MKKPAKKPRKAKKTAGANACSFHGPYFDAHRGRKVKGAFKTT